MKLQRHREEQTRHCEREKQQNQSIYVILLQFSLHMQDSARERETTTLLSFIACRCAHAPRHPQQQHQLACTQIKAKTNEQHQAITSRAETREKESRMDMWVLSLSLSLVQCIIQRPYIVQQATAALRRNCIMNHIIQKRNNRAAAG